MTSSSSAPFRTVWDTQLIPPHDRYSFFQDVVCKSFFSITPEGNQPTMLRAKIRRAGLNQSSFANALMSPHPMRRTAADLARIRGDHLVLSCYLRGSMTATYGNETHEQPPGMIFLNEAHALTSCFSTARYVTSSLILDRAKIQREIGRLAPYQRIEGTYEPLIRSCLTMLSQRFETATFAELDQLAEAARNLLCAQLICDPDYLESAAPSGGAAAVGILAALDRAIASDATNPNLSAKIVAQRLGISPRYVHKLFQERGTTFGRVLRDVRLDLVRSDLTKGQLRALNVADVAARNGFRDITSFHRVFKARFDETPRRMRLRLTDQD